MSEAMETKVVLRLTRSQHMALVFILGEALRDNNTVHVDVARDAETTTGDLFTLAIVSYESGDGVDMISAERTRQMTAEGFSRASDEAYTQGQLLNAALCYAQRRSDSRMFGYAVESVGPPARWPWGNVWWKPTTEIGDLVKAGALIAAEIDRLQRAQAKVTQTPS